MNFDDTNAEAVFRAAARDWLQSNRLDLAREAVPDDPFAAVLKWQKIKHAGGWGCISWPSEFGGRGASAIEAAIFAQEEQIAGMDGLSAGLAISVGMAAHTIMACGSDEQRTTHLPRIASGEEVWCQMFSEPGAGSDLAGISTSAARDGDDWIINGQKVWTSLAQYSDWAILITRSDTRQRKHKGLTYFLLDLRTPGVEIRPIREATGNSSFNEIFLKDVRIPDACRVGDAGDGWRVCLTTLMSERAVVSGTLPSYFSNAWKIAAGTPLEDGTALDDGAVRGLLADWYVWSSAMKNYGLRMQSQLSQGKTPGPEASIAKLKLAQPLQQFLSALLDMLDVNGAALSAGDSARLHRSFLHVMGHRLGGGTDETLRNIVGERVLGLPPEPRIDKELSFEELARRARQVT